MSNGRLQGKVATVTGAASQGPGKGNGKAVSILFTQQGAKLLLVNRSIERVRNFQGFTANYRVKFYY